MRLHRRTSIAVALATAAVGFSACGGDDGDNAGSEPAAATNVTVKTFMFEPDPLRVEAGTKVTWTNEDAAVHTVTTGPRGRPDGRVDGKLEKSGGTFSATFDKPGTYRYFCSLHSGPGMEAELVVE